MKDFLDEARGSLDSAIVHRDARDVGWPGRRRLPRLRRMIDRLADTWTGRQARFDEAVLVALAALVEECGDMDTRIEQIEHRLEGEEPPNDSTEDARGTIS